MVSVYTKWRCSTRVSMRSDYSRAGSRLTRGCGAGKITVEVVYGYEYYFLIF